MLEPLSQKKKPPTLQLEGAAKTRWSLLLLLREGGKNPCNARVRNREER